MIRDGAEADLDSPPRVAPAGAGPLTRLLGAVSALSLGLAAVGLVLMTAIIAWQIFGRYVLNDTPSWSERLSIFLMNWYILLAAAAGVREDFHIGLVFFRERLTGKPRLAIEALGLVAIVVFGLGMTVYGGQLALQTRTHVIPTLGLSTGWSYAPFVLAGVLIALFGVERLAKLRAHGVARLRTFEPGSSA